jgi:hypothetical protein
MLLKRMGRSASPGALICCLVGCLSAGTSAAESIAHRSDGVGSLLHRGDDRPVYSKTPRDTEILGQPDGKPGLPDGRILYGEPRNRSVTPFGSPLPPNNITPAPVLPLNPRLGPAPVPPAPPTVPFNTPTPALSGGRR